ncbi:hypothetical protein AeRB84_009472 [Aphanomyces euteiches]|nr:hypothetical protein AeRB84_009472 [Aphanomyces euteiches]
MDDGKRTHRPYSEKKRILALWEKERTIDGMTKVKFSRKMGTALSTFDKWCKNGEIICQMEDTDKKHLVTRPKKRCKYDKQKRPLDEREGLLYDWVQQAPQPINHKAMRARALELWPEYRDEKHPKCKTPGNFRKYCFRFAQRYSPCEDDNEDNTSHDSTPADAAAIDGLDNSQLAADETPATTPSIDEALAQAAADRAAAEAAARQAAADLAAAKVAAEQAAAVKAAADRDAAEILAAERIAAERTAAERAAAERSATERDIADRDQLKVDDCSTKMPAPVSPIDLTSVPSPPSRRSRKLSNPLNPADADVLASLYEHILENAFPRNSQGKPLPRRIAKSSLGMKNKRGIHNDHCSRCSARSPCVNFNICENIQSKAECASNRCMAGAHCKNNAIQKRRYPPTTVVVDPVFGYSLRLNAAAKKETKIIEYVGERISKQEFLRRKSLPGADSWYLAQLAREEGEMYVDARTMGNFSRFINHSCDPNCRFETWWVDKKPRLMVVARHDLPKNSILTLYYMDPTWQVDACLCGICDGGYLPPPQDSYSDLSE